MAKRKRHGNKAWKTDVTLKDQHHILYQRRRWKNGPVRELREFWYCKVYIPRNTLHREIHARVSCVPVPNHVNARAALYQLKMLEKHGAIRDTDSLEKRIVILIALFDCAEQATTDALRRQLEIVRSYDKPSE